MNTDRLTIFYRIQEPVGNVDNICFRPNPLNSQNKRESLDPDEQGLSQVGGI
jgi:hypothetical protein